jgi:hypothetical protein
VAQYRGRVVPETTRLTTAIVLHLTACQSGRVLFLTSALNCEIRVTMSDELPPSAERLLQLLYRWRDAGKEITRIAVGTSALNCEIRVTMSDELPPSHQSPHMLHCGQTVGAAYLALTPNLLQPERRPGCHSAPMLCTDGGHGLARCIQNSTRRRPSKLYSE